VRPPKLVTVVPEPAPTPEQAEAAVSGEGCELVIYSEPNFGGVSSDTGEPQPKLSEVGWLYEISSIEVKAGTWDFYEAENYAGESMQLAVGSYPTLEGGWDKAIGSFMCSQPAQ
jgi:hypothetical protein